MTGIALVAAALLAAAEPATVDTAQPTSAHQQHQATGQHQADADSDARCCCEEMMHKMILEMTQKHRGMDRQHPATAATPKPEDHKH